MALVTVSMPVGPGVPLEMVQRAVGAIRAQHFDDWRLVLIADGPNISLPSTRGESRVVHFYLPENRGRYFADAVALAGTSSEWFTVHDADDHASPRWLATMLERSAGRPVVLTSQRVQRLNGRFEVECVSSFRGSLTLHHHGHMAGLWRRSWLDAVGAPHPAFRVGFDTLLTSLPWLTEPEGPAIVNDPVLYHRCKRPGSLTTSLATGMRSRVRAQAREDLIELYGFVLDALNNREQGFPREDLIGQVLSAYPSHQAYADLMSDVEREAKRLRDLVGE